MAPKIWFITGASSGMGRSLTEYVLSKGDIAVATLRSPNVLSDLTEKYSKDQLLVLKLDVTHLQEILDAFVRAKEVFGRIDVVYNNAGIVAVGEVEGTPLSDARALFEVNFWGAINVARESVRFFREENRPCGGSLINMSSIVSLVGHKCLGFYSSTKFALNGAIEALAAELDPAWNIKISLVELGTFRTRVTKESMIRTPIHPAYDNPSHPTYEIRAYLESDPKLPGDAHKASKQIYKLADMENPPLHLPLGRDAVQMALDKSKTYAEAAEKYASWSEDLNHD